MSAARIGVFGGTFDPPHLGHLIAARDVVEALGLERMLMVLAARPPHKPSSGAGAPAPPNVRWEMLRAAVEGDPLLDADDIELRREGPSYTVDTLEALRQRRPHDALHLVVGAEQFAALATWRRPEAVARLARLTVVEREGAGPRALEPGSEVAFDVVAVTRVDVSSSAIRGRVGEGRSIRYQVPEPVERIIEREGLYAQAAAVGVRPATRRA